MEYKIGQIFEMDGIWYQFVRDNSNGCNSCVFHTMGNKCVNPEEGVRCGSWNRIDERGGHFVRLLPLGGEYEQGEAMWQQYKCIEKPNTEDERVYIAHTEVGKRISWGYYIIPVERDEPIVENDEEYKTYEEALEAGLKRGLKLIKK